MTTKVSNFFQIYRIVLKLLPWKSSSASVVDIAHVLFLYNPDSAQIPIYITHSHVPEEADLSSNPKGGLNGLRVTPTPLPVFGWSMGMKPNFAQWTKKSAGGFLRHVSFFSNARLLEEVISSLPPFPNTFLDVLPGTAIAVFLVSLRMTTEWTRSRWPRYGKNQDPWN